MVLTSYLQMCGSKHIACYTLFLYLIYRTLLVSAALHILITLNQHFVLVSGAQYVMEYCYCPWYPDYFANL